MLSRRSPGPPRRPARFVAVRSTTKSNGEALPMTQAPSASRELDWLVNNFADRVVGVSHAIVVSGDGLKLAVSERVDEDRADQLAAVASGLASLTLGAARCFDAEPVNQTIVEMGGGYLFVT